MCKDCWSIGCIRCMPIARGFLSARFQIYSNLLKFFFPNNAHTSLARGRLKYIYAWHWLIITIIKSQTSFAQATYFTWIIFFWFPIFYHRHLCIDQCEENHARVQMSDGSPGSKSKQTSSASFWLDNGKVGVMKKTIAWLQVLPSLLSSPVPPLLPSFFPGRIFLSPPPSPFPYALATQARNKQVKISLFR